MLKPSKIAIIAFTRNVKPPLTVDIHCRNIKSCCKSFQNLCSVCRNTQVLLSKLDMFVLQMLIGSVEEHDDLSGQLECFN